MLVEMSEQGAEAPAQVEAFHDARGVLNKIYACKRPGETSGYDYGVFAGQTVRLTNLTEGNLWIQAAFGYSWVNTEGEKKQGMDAQLEDANWGVRRAEPWCSNGRYGTTTSRFLGPFKEDIKSDYVEFRDALGNACLVVHRIAAGGASAAPAYMPPWCLDYMGQREEFEAQIVHLLAWLRTCTERNVDINGDIATQCYKENFLMFLKFRFLKMRSCYGNGPKDWLRSLAATAASLHQTPLGGLMLVEMFDTGKEDPALHTSFYDDNAVLNIEFVCKKCDETSASDGDGGMRQSVRLTILAEGTYWIQAACGYGGVGTNGDEIKRYGSQLKDPTWGVQCAERGCSNGRYGTTTSLDMGTFDADTESDYVEFRDTRGRACLIVHRIAAASASAAPARPPTKRWRERDPVGFALRKAQMRARMRDLVGKAVFPVAAPFDKH